MLKRALFLDRDGILNKLVKNRPPWNIDEINIYPEASTIIEHIKKYSYIPIIVTNQPDAGRGKLTYEKLYQINDYISNILEIEYKYICPHPYDGMCNCRKPLPGMLLRAKEENNIDLHNSILIGDREKDIQAGRSAGCKTIFLSAEDCSFADYNVENHLELLLLIKKLIPGDGK